MFNELLITIISGVLVFAFSQIVKDFFLTPIIKQRALIGQISNALDFYANLYTNFPQDSEQESTDRQTMHVELRNLGVELTSNSNLLPFYDLFVNIKLITQKKKIFETKRELIGLSNGSWPQNHDHIHNNDQRAEKIKGLLNITL